MNPALKNTEIDPPSVILEEIIYAVSSPVRGDIIGYDNKSGMRH